MTAAVAAVWLLDDGEHVAQRLATGARVVRAIGEPGGPIPVLEVVAVFDLHHGAGRCPWCGARAVVPYRVGAVRLRCCGGRCWPQPAWPEEPRILRPVRHPARRWSP